MSDSASRIARAARTLDEARLARTAIAQGDIDVRGLDEAYAVQAAGMQLRQARGEAVCGLKLGFTSRAKMQQMGVADMIIGRLGEATRVDDGAAFSRASAIHPRIEPELAFLIVSDLPPDAGLDEWQRAAQAVAPAMEIIDSRYRDFRFDLPAVVADNTSACAFVLGAWQPLRPALDNLGLQMSLGGRSVVGSTAAILGEPRRALAAAWRLARRHGLPLRAGSVLLAGAATAAEPLPAQGPVSLEMSGLGRVLVHIEA